MTDAHGLLFRLARYRVDYSRRSYSLDVADIETVLAMGRRIEELEASLRFYADPKTHEVDDANGYYPDAVWPICEDAGHRARVALGEEK